MQRFFKWVLRSYITVFIILSIIHYMEYRYDIFVTESHNGETIANAGTLVIFEKEDIRDMEQYDIVAIGEDGRQIARIMSIDLENDTLKIVTDDFGEEKEISAKEVRGILKFHIREIGILYEKYISNYKAYIMILPFVLLIFSFAAFTWNRCRENKEDIEFLFHEHICSFKEYQNHKISYIKKEYMECITEQVDYNTNIKNGKVPEFNLKWTTGLVQNRN